jgi:glycosyltransferase involved in cell wall biosynthesis
MLKKTWRRATSLLDPVASFRNGIGSLRERASLLRGERLLVQEHLRAAGEQCASIARVAAQSFESLRWLLEHYPESGHRVAARPEPRPLISIIMPVYNREQTIGAAIASVQAQTYPAWELIVIDDGSTDRTPEVVAQYESDPRIRRCSQKHAGHCAARNHGLAESRGEIIAYLDSDNTWYPRYLERVASALGESPEADSVYLAQLVRGRATAYVRGLPFDRQRLERANYIDLSVFAHRRRLVDTLGGFDESLTRLVDWDLILRYTAAAAPLAVPMLGGCYRTGRSDRITTREGCNRNDYLIRRKHDGKRGSHLRVLYALWHYPQLTETYIRWEIECMQRWGVHVEVWSERESPAAPFVTDVPVHHGSLAAAIARTRPHLVHVHWLHSAVQYDGAIRKAGLPLTVRGHGFEVARRHVLALQRSPTVQAVYLFPHLARSFPGMDKVRPMTTAFNGDLFYPGPHKDRRLVVRTGPGLPTKDVQAFFDVARSCPDHRFVLVLARCNEHERFLDKVDAYNRKLGSPVELRINEPVEQVAALVREAGIYLHTHGLAVPYGMPISIAEAMATGSYVIGRRCRASEAYIGNAGRVYGSAAEAAQQIQRTAQWSDEQWQRAQRRAVERAYRHFADIRVLRPMLEDWLRIAGPSTSRAHDEATPAAPASASRKTASAAA